MTPENLSGRTIAGYRLLELVGEGGTATVYRAEHPDRGRAAVKVLKQQLRNDPTAVKRFLREAGYGTRVIHPHVVRTFDYGEQERLHYLALEWADGESLSEFASRCGALAPTLVSRIVSQLAAALTVAHAAGIIHRDLKPENIIYDAATQEAKLLDFGIARDAQADVADRLTRAGFFVGTLQYVAPEALSGELVGEAADIYSLATITYFLITGKHPYRGRTTRELFQQLLKSAPVPMNDDEGSATYPEKLERVVMRALSREPGRRQATIQAFADDLAAAVAAGGDPPVKSDTPRSSLASIKAFFGRLGGGKTEE